MYHSHFIYSKILFTRGRKVLLNTHWYNLGGGGGEANRSSDELGHVRYSTLQRGQFFRSKRWHDTTVVRGVLQLSSFPCRAYCLLFVMFLVVYSGALQYIVIVKEWRQPQSPRWAPTFPVGVLTAVFFSFHRGMYRSRPTPYRTVLSFAKPHEYHDIGRNRHNIILPRAVSYRAVPHHTL